MAGGGLKLQRKSFQHSVYGLGIEVSRYGICFANSNCIQSLFFDDQLETVYNFEYIINLTTDDGFPNGRSDHER